jgi:hypothetical protein
MRPRDVDTPTWTHFEPLDLWCPVCNASPGVRCAWQPASGPPLSRRPHADRITDARAATERARKRATQPPPGWSVRPPPAGST